MSREYLVISGPSQNGRLYLDEQRGAVISLLPNQRGYTHAANLLEMPNGDLLCCWFAGNRGEGKSDVNVYLSRLSKDESQWSEPVRVSDDDERSEQNPSLYLHPNGDVDVIYTAHCSSAKDLPPHTNLQYTSVIRRRRSHDGGHTFGETVTLFDQAGSFCRQSPQRLRSGRIVFSNWLCFNDDSHNFTDVSVVRISDDDGQTWHTVPIPESQGLVHANLIERDHGRLLALFRSRAADSIYLASSEDEGETWSNPMPTELPNNNAGLSAIALQSGGIAIAYNACSFAAERNVGRWPRQRAPIAVAISTNEGKSWDFRRVAEPAEGFCGRLNGASNQRYEYPALLQTRDGMLHLAYTNANRSCIKYMRFTEQWVMGEKQMDEGLRYVY